MFREFIEWIRKAVSKILPSKTLEKQFDIEVDISDVMTESIQLWSDMYQERAHWVDGNNVKSLGIASSVASEISRLVTIEMESNITNDNDRARYLDERYQRVVDSLRTQTEYAVAKGGMIFRPYLDGNDNISIEYVQADNFYPVDFNASGDLVGVIFPEVIVKGDKTYTRLEYHQMLSGNRCYIQNQAFVKASGGDGLGLTTSLQAVKGWENLEPEITLLNITEPLFSYFKMPLANNKDTKSQLGVSVYAKAENLIREVDEHYSRIIWEYSSKETAIDVPIDMFINRDMPKGKERLFRQLDVDESQGRGNFYEVFSPEIRDTSLFNGLNQILQRVEFNCGLAYGTLSDISEVAKTATEIKASKQRSYSTIVDIQKALRVSLEHLIRSMDYLIDLYGLAPSGDFEVSFDFDDSIIVDTETEQAIMLNEVSANLIRPEYYLQRRYGVSEQEALDMLPDSVKDMTLNDFDDLE